VWSQIKGDVARNNRRSPKIDDRSKPRGDIEKWKACVQHDIEKWKACVQHEIEKEEVKMWDLDCLTEETAKGRVISVRTSTDDTDEDVDGVEPFENSD
jgi:hypothetical protein